MPPVVIVCRPWARIASADHTWVSLRFDAYCAPAKPAVPLEKMRFGGPQLTASWLFPEISAWPDTFVRPEKNGVTAVVRPLN